MDFGDAVFTLVEDYGYSEVSARGLVKLARDEGSYTDMMPHMSVTVEDGGRGKGFRIMAGIGTNG